MQPTVQHGTIFPEVVATKKTWFDDRKRCESRGHGLEDESTSHPVIVQTYRFGETKRFGRLAVKSRVDEG